MWNKHTQNVVINITSYDQNNKCKFPVRYTSYLAKLRSICHIMSHILSYNNPAHLASNSTLKCAVQWNASVTLLLLTKHRGATFTNAHISYSLQIILFLIRFISNFFQHDCLKVGITIFVGMYKILLWFLHLFPLY